MILNIKRVISYHTREKKQRLNWCLVHSNSTVNDWRDV